jgi:hypothetical protein
MPRPISFAKEHPVAVITNMALGMIIGPYVLSLVGRYTGVSVALPKVG